MQQALVQQRLHERLNAADLYEFGHGIAARRTHVRQHRHPIADAGEVIQLQRHVRGMGNCQQVQDGVGRTFECHADGDRILERLEAKDVGRFDVAVDQRPHRGARVIAIAALVFADGVLGRRVRQRQAQGFDGGGHGIRRVHPAA